MTLINESDQTILKMYLHTKMNFLGEGFQKLRLEYYRDATERITTHIPGGKNTFRIPNVKIKLRFWVQP